MPRRFYHCPCSTNTSTSCLSALREARYACTLVFTNLRLSTYIQVVNTARWGSCSRRTTCYVCILWWVGRLEVLPSTGCPWSGSGRSWNWHGSRSWWTGSRLRMLCGYLVLFSKDLAMRKRGKEEKRRDMSGKAWTRNVDAKHRYCDEQIAMKRNQ